ncbi:NfeD family protein [Herbiconiux sp. KACC 21604]|uniref:NfeD family protein n=1 Tax=unclassified Herbiconiux TaxID=2618217 RepID=UPI001490A096|nr:NfeD family protein [Herbiconiux sp. SALV-R1]QJU53503.1 NfeD family protein [Herbiconiux sp. SALV-R1]WPO88479.1 NfeD family protein [Herbiconiux sp. KACC 21604]
MLEFLDSYAWIFWLGLILLFIVIEMLTLEFTFLMIAIGSLGGLIAGALGVPWYYQIVIAAVLSLLLLLTLRPPLLRRLKRGGDPAKSNVDALLGLEGLVLDQVTSTAGHVKLANGDTWTARVSPAADIRDLPRGERVLVTAIDGATAIVVPAGRTEPKEPIA